MESGIIVRLSDSGFGYIARVGDDRDLFFHSNELTDTEFDELRVGDILEFNVAEGLKGPIAVNVGRNGGGFVGHTWSAKKVELESAEARVVAREVIESFQTLTPDLIQHLKRENSDIEKVHPEVCEHLVAELMASAGWDEVKLVGRSTDTSADIFAVHYMPGGFDIPVRYFVEVKRHKNRIGVEVFDQVYGAMILERERHGWHVALIVALGGISNTRKFSRDEYRKKGLEVRDKEDLIRWLDDYEPKANGLWVSAHFTGKIEKKR